MSNWKRHALRKFRARKYQVHKSQQHQPVPPTRAEVIRRLEAAVDPTSLPPGFEWPPNWDEMDVWIDQVPDPNAPAPDPNRDPNGIDHLVYSDDGGQTWQELPFKNRA